MASYKELDMTERLTLSVSALMVTLALDLSVSNPVTRKYSLDLSGPGRVPASAQAQTSEVVERIRRCAWLPL